MISSDGGGAMQVADTQTVDLALLGSGTTADPWILSAVARVDPVAGNLLVEGPDGLGVTCESVQDCVGNSLGPGLSYDDEGNTIAAQISNQDGNSLSVGPDGGLFAPTGGGATIVTTDSECIALDGNGAGTPLSAAPVIDPAASNLLACGPDGMAAELAIGACGLAGDGSGAAPLSVRVQPWPYPCDVNTAGGEVYCDDSGQLRTGPRGTTDSVQASDNQTYPSLSVPSGFDNVIVTRSLTVTNSDPCLPARVLLEGEFDVDFDLPPGAGAAYGIDNDEMAYHHNTGSSTVDSWHVQTTKVVDGGVLPPGESTTYDINVTMGRGRGGATYNRIQSVIRAFLIVV